VVITYVEQWIGRRYQILPVEIDLIRNIRYVSPILLIFGIWGTWRLTQRLPRRTGAIMLVAVSLVWFSVNRPGSIPFRTTAECFLDGRILCRPDHVDGQLAALEFAKRDIPQRVPILPILNAFNGMDFVLALRYFAFKPVVFAEKDGGTFTYANHAAIDGWLRIRSEIAAVRAIADPAERLARAEALGRQTGAGLIVVDFPVPQTADVGGCPSRRTIGPFTFIGISGRIDPSVWGCSGRAGG
jgi:hypothetical protein